MNVGVVADKGGSGKTTVSLHLARFLDELYGNVVLIDQDPNRSAIKYEARGVDAETGGGIRVLRCGAGRRLPRRRRSRGGGFAGSVAGGRFTGSRAVQ